MPNAMDRLIAVPSRNEIRHEDPRYFHCGSHSFRASARIFTGCRHSDHRSGVQRGWHEVEGKDGRMQAEERRQASFSDQESHWRDWPWLRGYRLVPPLGAEGRCRRGRLLAQQRDAPVSPQLGPLPSRSWPSLGPPDEKPVTINGGSGPDRHQQRSGHHEGHGRDDGV
jgi:hypothetical protein